MKISRIRIAALGAAAILMLGGASVALAQNPSAKAMGTVPAAVEDPASGPDTDNVESGDQTGPDVAGPDEADNGVEDASGPDTDVVQEGDQTGPDSATEAAQAAQPASAAASKADSSAESAAESESASESESAAESDGPGGHQDADGQNADHQFEGEE